MPSTPPPPPGPDAPDPSGPTGALARARSWWTQLARVHPVATALIPGLLLVALGGLGVAVMLDSVLEQDDFSRLDEPVLTLLVALRGPVGTTVMAAVTTVSGPLVLPLLVAAGASVWAWRTGERWRPALLPAAMAAGALMSLLIKHEVGRPRPPVETMYIPDAVSTASFPSGHTTGTATLCLVLGYLLWSRRLTTRGLVVWATTTVVATGAVGLSRLYLGYHFVTDVLAGAALAVVVLGLVVAVDQAHLNRAARRAGGPYPQAPGSPGG